MNKVLIGLYIVKEKKILECTFDTRISMKDNMEHLKELVLLPEGENRLYDIRRRCFIDMNKTPAELNLKGYHLFHMFTLDE